MAVRDSAHQPNLRVVQQAEASAALQETVHRVQRLDDLELKERLPDEACNVSCILVAKPRAMYGHQGHLHVGQLAILQKINQLAVLCAHLLGVHDLRGGCCSSYCRKQGLSALEFRATHLVPTPQLKDGLEKAFVLFEILVSCSCNSIWGSLVRECLRQLLGRAAHQ